MTPPLFLLHPLPQLGDFVLDGDEGHHARVQRIQPGEIVLVADGLGGVLECETLEVSPTAVRLRALTARTEPVPVPRLVVVQALPKGERGELAVELLTELGVDEIVPWAASRSIAKWQGERGRRSLERWRRTARESGKQSRRPRLPMVADLAATDDVLRMIGAAGVAFVLHEDATSPLATVAAAEHVGDVVIVVGPEGGVAPDELARFTALGATEVRLGSPVLRTSTAGAAALAVLSVRLGRWS